MPSLVIVGAQWGDEGKGKFVDFYSQFADVAVRFSGGANAGHTLIVNGQKLITHLIPSGSVHSNVRTVVMAGNMVIESAVLLDEIRELATHGISVDDRLVISHLAHLVLPVCKDLDALREAASGGKIGTTKRGIGQTYELKAGRVGIRFSDLKRPERFSELARAVLGRTSPEIQKLGGEPRSETELVQFLEEARAFLSKYVANISKILETETILKSRILFEGAQGTELDIDHGTYPFVTSGNVVAPSAAIGAGIGMQYLPHVYGVTKAYDTRVGGGPFVTELKGEVGEKIRADGGEYGATTGRPRRVGWLDLPQLIHAARVNGLTGFVLTKADVLRGHKEIQVCVGYNYKGRTITEIDELDAYELESAKPIYVTIPGFDDDMRDCRKPDELPKTVARIVRMVRDFTGVPVVAISTGPAAEQTIVLQNPLAEVDDARTF